MATSNVNVRVDSDLKKQAEILFSDLGLNMSTAIIIFLRAAISHGGLPFEVKLTDLHPKERTMVLDRKVRSVYNSFEDVLCNHFEDEADEDFSENFDDDLEVLEVPSEDGEGTSLIFREPSNKE